MTGGDQAIAAFGILMSIVSMIVLPLMGFVTGSQPIIGYNYGAKYNNRVRDTLKFTMLYATAFIVIAWILMMTNTLAFVAPFVPNDQNMQQLTCKALRTFICMMPFVPLGMVSGNFFQGTGNAVSSFC